jgi:hypothetical protein
LRQVGRKSSTSTGVLPSGSRQRDTAGWAPLQCQTIHYNQVQQQHRAQATIGSRSSRNSPANCSCSPQQLRCPAAAHWPGAAAHLQWPLPGPQNTPRGPRWPLSAAPRRRAGSSGGGRSRAARAGLRWLGGGWGGVAQQPKPANAPKAPAITPAPPAGRFHQLLPAVAHPRTRATSKSLMSHRSRCISRWRMLLRGRAVQGRAAQGGAAGRVGHGQRQRRCNTHCYPQLPPPTCPPALTCLPFP